MPSIPNIPVGTDNHVPTAVSDNLWRMWAEDQVYMGAAGFGKYVVKQGDWVVNLSTLVKRRVTSVDAITCIPVLELIQDNVQTTPVDPLDAFFGTGPGIQSDNQFVYFNDTVSPFSLCVDASVKVAGSDNIYARIFKGTDISNDSNCISRIYDQTNTLVDDKLLLEMSAQDNVTNNSIKTIQPCQTTSHLANGEKVTVVVYNSQAHVVYVRQLIVVKTAFVRSVNSSRKHIINIGLKSPFLSQSNPSLLQYPINVPLTGLNLTGIVYYSDGSIRELPVNGHQFAITGFESFSATKQGETFQAVLHYYPSAGELSYVLSGGPIDHISKQITCTVTPSDGAYNVKLYGYPYWVDDVNGYRFKWFVTNLERSLFLDVTAMVRINENIVAFNPTQYGVTQTIVATILFNQINPSWRAFKFVQPMKVTLINPAVERTGDNWALSYNPDGTPLYGINCKAQGTMINGTTWSFDLTSGATTQEQWLQKFYLDTLPLMNSSVELAPPTPTHFSIITNTGAVRTFPIASWDQTLSVNGLFHDSDTLIVKFIKQTVNQPDMTLAVVGIPIWQN